MNNNIILFPGTTRGDLEDDDFCGAAGFMFEGGQREEMPKVYDLEAGAMRHIKLAMNQADTASVEYHDPEALTEEFKAVLLEVLHRRQRENVRAGRILTVSHPLMKSDEQVPFLIERSETPAITVRRATYEDLAMIDSLRLIFPVLSDVRNAIRSSNRDRELNGFPGFFV